MGEIAGFFVSLGAWNWLIFGGLLLILEFVLPGFYLFFFGLSAILTGALALSFPVPWQGQAAMFVVVSLVNTFVARFFWDPNVKSDEPLLNKRGEQHIGKIYKLSSAIENGRGKVKVGDSLWLVSGPDMPEGTRVKVVSAEGSMLVVDEVS